MSEGKEYLNYKEFEAGLKELDKKMGSEEWLVAFAPIRLITAGGFLAVSYLHSRDTTGDIDYLIDPEFAGDKDIQNAFQKCILSVANDLQYNEDWINEAMSIFVDRGAQQSLFQEAVRRDISLFKGENLEILAAPIEWALERKLRRIYNGNRDRKAELDMADAVAILKHMRTLNNGPLDLESIRTMNLNGFDVVPDHDTMRKVADEYRRKYDGEDIFKEQ